MSKRQLVVIVLVIMGSGSGWAKVPHDVKPPLKMLTCSTDKDCIIVSNSCDGCCQQASINASYKDSFTKFTQEICNGYKDSVCECQAAVVFSVCYAGFCSFGNKN